MKYGYIICIVMMGILCNSMYSQKFVRDIRYEEKKMNGNDIDNVQERLFELNFITKNCINGWYEKNSEKAIYLYQEYIGMNSTGIIDLKMWSIIFSKESTIRNLDRFIIKMNNQDIKKLEIITKDIYGYSLEGGQIREYLMDKKVQYEEIDLYGEMGKVNYKIFFFNDEIAILQKTYKYPQTFDIENAIIENTAYYSSKSSEVKIEEGNITAFDIKSLKIFEIMKKENT